MNANTWKVSAPNMTDPFGVPSSGRPPTSTRPRGDAEDRAQIPRDQWDRYLMKHLDGSKPAKNKGFTRVSTTKKALSNQEGIRTWAEGLIAEGMGTNDALIQRAMEAQKIIDPDTRKRTFRKIAQDAFVLAGGKERSGRGTAFHEVTEELNRGRIDYNTGLSKLSPEDGESLLVYREMLERNNIQVLPNMLERQVLCPYNQAGTFDNMVRWWNPDTEEWELLIGDLKTGRTIDLGALEILIQLWNYANAYAIWTTTSITMSDDGSEVIDFDGFYEPMPAELRRDKAIIFHVPLDGTATAYILDLGGVEEAVRAAVTAKRWNAEAKHKFRRLETVAPAAFVTPKTPAQIMERVPVADRQQAEALAADPGLKYHPQTTEQTRAPIDYPTPDAQAQADIAQSRLAKLNETLRRVVAEGRNDEEDEPEQGVSPHTVQDQLNGIGQPLAPLAGPGKRGCSVCGRTGHTSKTKQPICLGDRDPAKGAPDNQTTVTVPSQTVIDATKGPEQPRPSTEEIAAFVAGTDPMTPAEDKFSDAPSEAENYPQHEAAQELSRVVPVEDLPYCFKSHAHNWTSNHPDAPGQWVCADTGKPSKEVWEKHTRTVLAADHADGDDAPPPPATWAAYTPPAVDPIADQIAAAGNRQALATFRQRTIEAGQWSDAYEQAAWTRYSELTS